jgi:competence protein ComEA
VLPTVFRRRPRPEEVAAAHARLAALGFAPLGNESLMTGGWVPQRDPVAPQPVAESTDVPLPEPIAPERFAPSRLLDRLAIRPSAAAGLVVVAVLAVLIAAAVAWNARARPVTSVAPPATQAQPAASTRAAANTVVVDVAGKVRRPGLVTLPLGSRVADALRAAGGARPGTDLTALNLARKLVDGEQIVVGAPAPVALDPPGASGSTTGSTSGGAVVNLNTATVADFDTLPGIGPVLAQRILDWRTAHGGFTGVSQLRQVSGIGDSKYAQIKGLVRV